MSAKLCFTEKTAKIVFSAEHSFCVSQIVKPPFEGKTKNGTFETKVPFWVFPCARWNPDFCSVWWFSMVTEKSDIFQKQIVATKNARFSLTIRTQIVFANFLKNAIFAKKLFLFTATRQTANKYFRAPTHYLCFFKIPLKTLSNWGKQAKKVLDQVLTQPWTKFWLKNPNLGPSFDSTAIFWVFLVFSSFCFVSFDGLRVRWGGPGHLTWP